MSPPISIRQRNFRPFSLANSVGSEAALVALSRLASTELALKEFTAAKLTIANTRAQGLNSYESIHNEAILAAATTNLAESRQLVDRLSRIDRERLSSASLSAGILLEPLPLGVLAERYLGPIESHLQISPAAIQWISSEQMLAPLCSMGLVGLLFLSVTMIGLLIVPSSKLRGLA